jgi:uncharacterized glyoxalase superfamily protein PhnB
VALEVPGEVGLVVEADADRDVRRRLPSRSRCRAISFRCESPADVDDLYARALQAGGRSHRAPWDAFWGQRYAQLRDPDGNGVDLYADLE